MANILVRAQSLQNDLLHCGHAFTRVFLPQFAQTPLKLMVSSVCFDRQTSAGSTRFRVLCLLHSQFILVGIEVCGWFWRSFVESNSNADVAEYARTVQGHLARMDFNLYVCNEIDCEIRFRQPSRNIFFVRQIAVRLTHRNRGD